MNTKIVIGVVVGAVLGFIAGSLVYNGSFPGFGRGTGPVHWQTESFLQGLAAGTTDQFVIENDGDVITSSRVTFDEGVLHSSAFSTTSQGTVTYTAANITDVSTILHNAAGALTGNLPASTTLSDFVPNAGDMRRIVLVNTGSATITLAGGTGTLLKTASSTKQVLSGGAAILDFVRKTDTDIAVFMSTAI